VKNIYNWMDLVSVVPFVAHQIFGVSETDNLALEVVGLMVPSLRLMKVTRRSNSWQLLLLAMRSAATPMLVPLFFLLVIVIFFSSVFFWVERRMHSEYAIGASGEAVAPTFASIPHAMWYTIVTISTVGYGDLTTQSDAGKIVTGALILTGVIYMAMPLSIVGATFTRVWDDRDRIIVYKKVMKRWAESGYSHEALADFFLQVDADKSGQIDIQEFQELLAALQVGLSNKASVRLFKTFDEDGSGSINIQELLESLFPDALDGVANEVSMDAIANMVRKVDAVVREGQESRLDDESPLGCRFADAGAPCATPVDRSEERHSTGNSLPPAPAPVAPEPPPEPPTTDLPSSNSGRLARLITGRPTGVRIGPGDISPPDSGCDMPQLRNNAHAVTTQNGMGVQFGVPEATNPRRSATKHFHRLATRGIGNLRTTTGATEAKGKPDKGAAVSVRGGDMLAGRAEGTRGVMRRLGALETTLLESMEAVESRQGRLEREVQALTQLVREQHTLVSSAFRRSSPHDHLAESEGAPKECAP